MLRLCRAARSTTCFPSPLERGSAAPRFGGVQRHELACTMRRQSASGAIDPEAGIASYSACVSHPDAHELM